MTREEVERLSIDLSNRFERMMTQMSLSNTSESIPKTSSDMVYVRITEICNKWVEDERSITNMFADICIGLHTIGASLSVIFQGVNGETKVYVGSESENIETLIGLIRGTFRRIEVSDSSVPISFDTLTSSGAYSFGGFLNGNPSVSDNYLSPNLIDNVIKGMGDRSWIVSIFASAIDKSDTIALHRKWLIEASECSELQQITFSTTDSRENLSLNKHYFQSDNYCDKVSSFCEKLLVGINIGEWCVTVNYASESETGAKLLGGLLTSAYYGEDSEPEAIHTIYQDNDFSFLFYGDIKTHSSFLEGKEKYPKYGTYLNSNELGIISSFPTKDCCGFSVSDYVDFDVSRKKGGNLKIGKVLNGNDLSAFDYSIDINELNRHALICGLTGSGKTNTVKSIICGITKNGMNNFPFMIIEPAKREYWELFKLGYQNLQIYSIGSNEPDAHPYCINPFERVKVYDDNSHTYKMVSLQTHIDYVFAAFKASFIMYTPMPYVLETAIYSIYEDYGWDVKTDINKFGREEYPTIEDLFDKIPQIVIDMGYDQKMRKDLTGSLQARINSLRLGSKGDTLNVRKSFPVEHIFNGNVVIELEEIGDDDVKAFVISMLLIQLMEYRRQQPDSQLEVKHIMLIEEAHRLLKNVSSGTGENADPRGAAVEFFCNMLAEMRSKGQGFMIADQIPSKLAPDLIKNTNMKILHRTVAEEDRSLMGGAMHMTDAQIDYVSSLPQGHAAVYSEGDNRPKIVNPPYAGSFTLQEYKDIKRPTVLSLTQENCILRGDSDDYKSLTNRNGFCKHCNRFCKRKYTDVLCAFELDEFEKFADMINPLKTGTFVGDKIDACIQAFIAEKTSMYLPEHERVIAQCLVPCLMDRWDLSKRDPKLYSKIVDVYSSFTEE